MNYISIEDLEDCWVYRLKSNNLSCGVWRKETGGFIGIREKGGDEYLFEEFHWDGPAFATAKPLFRICEVEPWIPILEGMRVSASTGHPTVFRFDDGWQTPGHSVDFVTGERVEDVVYLRNRFLFDFLKPISDKYNSEP